MMGVFIPSGTVAGFEYDQVSDPDVDIRDPDGDVIEDPFDVGVENGDRPGDYEPFIPLIVKEGVFTVDEPEEKEEEEVIDNFVYPSLGDDPFIVDEPEVPGSLEDLDDDVVVAGVDDFDGVSMEGSHLSDFPLTDDLDFDVVTEYDDLDEDSFIDTFIDVGDFSFTTDGS